MLWFSVTITRGVWLVDNNVSRHIMGSHELFTSMDKEHHDLHVDLGDNVGY